MNEELLDLIKDIARKQEQIDKHLKEKSGELVKDLSFSEMHCINYIGTIERANVTKLSELLNITRGGISKIIKKLINKGFIETYTDKSNKKEIYYNLTQQGKIAFDEHEKIHSSFCSGDLNYFNKIDEKKLKIIKEFLENYNQYLSERL